jgi:hypothetical protein
MKDNTCYSTDDMYVSSQLVVVINLLAPEFGI